MTFHPQLAPIIQFRSDRIAHRARLQTERIAAEVMRVAAFVRRDQELITVGAQWVGVVGSGSPCRSGLVIHHSLLSHRARLAATASQPWSKLAAQAAPASLRVGRAQRSCTAWLLVNQ